MDVQILLEAIALRDAVRAGRMSRREIQERVRREFTAGTWSRGQLAAIVGYTEQGVGGIIRGAVRPSQRPVGGHLAVGTLDLALQLRGAVTREQERNLLDTCITLGTSTRLLARMTGRPLSTVAYRKARMKKEAP
jgi:hypothetical protein